MIETVATSLRWIVLIPLLGAALNGLLNRRPPRWAAGWLGCAAVGLSFALSVRAVIHLARLPAGERVLTDVVGRWLSFGSLHLDIGFMLDPLSAVMILVVTGIGLLIHIYSLGYMAKDEGLPRFFAYMNLTIFAMLLLVLGENLVLLFVGWQAVGLCSYLLIGFWFDDRANADAGRKAFIANRVGDVGVLLGMFLLGATLLPHLLAGEGVFSFAVLQQHGHLLAPVATAAALLFFLGVAGKSAQIPLYIWLPDAVAGPLPATALIQTAAMVTAGVYLMARLSFLFVLSPVALAVVAGAGIATALFAATIALAQTDIKKVLAYATISQLGYMVAACGLGAFTAGIFHLMTHAFCKALLILGAGSVIGAMHHEEDMRAMGGLKSKLPVTWAAMLVGTLAIAGVAPLAGFVSKNEILFEAFLGAHGGIPWIWIAGLLTAALTAFTMMRLLALTFLGECRAGAEVRAKIQESPATMTVPLVVLAVLSIAGGWIGWPHGLGGGAWLQEWLAPVLAGGQGQGQGNGYGDDIVRLKITLAVVATLVVLAGLAAGYVVYARKPSLAAAAGRWLGGVPRRILSRKYYVDELYTIVLYRPLRWLADVVLFRWLDRRLVDGLFVGGATIAVMVTGTVVRWLDWRLVDGLFVGGTAIAVMVTGSVLRLLQNGIVRFYAWIVAVGVALFALYAALYG